MSAPQAVRDARNNARRDSLRFRQDVAQIAHALCTTAATDIPGDVQELAEEIARRGPRNVSNAQRHAAASDTRTFYLYDSYVRRGGDWVPSL